jgi:hypothetical protein
MFRSTANTASSPFNAFIALLVMSITQTLTSVSLAQADQETFEGLRTQVLHEQNVHLTNISSVVNAIGRSDSPEPVYNWMRDNISVVSYSGILRGAEGVLRTGSGNSLDISILMAELLRTNGFDIRFAHARIDFEPQRQASNPIPAFNPSVRRLPPHISAHATSVKKLALQQSQIISESIETWPRAGQTMSIDLLADFDHWWIEVRRPGQTEWFALDVLAAEPGETIAQSFEQFDVETSDFILAALPESLRHSFTFRVIAEYALGDGYKQQEVFSTNIFPAGLNLNRGITFGLVPGAEIDSSSKTLDSASPFHDFLDAGVNATTWTPVLTLGEVNIAGTEFGLHYEGAASNSIFGGAAAGLGTLTQQLNPSKSKEGVGELSALWLEYEIQVPDRIPSTVRRMIFDLVGPTNRQNGMAFDFENADLTGRPAALVHSTQILPQIGFERPIFSRLNYLVAASEFIGNSNQYSKSMSYISRSVGLDQLALARRHWSPVGELISFDRLNILTQHSQVDQEGRKLVVAYDIVTNDVNVGSGDLVRAITQGVTDTIAEFVLLPGSDPRSNTAAMFDNKKLSGETWHAIDKTESARLAGYSFDQISSWSEVFDTGHFVIAPKTDLRTSYWSVDPETGNVLGIGPTGWGSSFVEKTVLETRNAMQIFEGTAEYQMVIALATACLWIPALAPELNNKYAICQPSDVAGPQTEQSEANSKTLPGEPPNVLWLLFDD